MRTIILELHVRARGLADKIRRVEAELVEVLGQIDACHGYLELGYPSLFAYATKELKLSEASAYNFILVSRKARMVPAVLAALANGDLTVSKAKSIASVVTRENSAHWLALARVSSARELEWQVAKVNPGAMHFESVKPLSDGIVRLELTINEKTLAVLRRAQEVLSQKTGSVAKLREVLQAVGEDYLERHDPVRKAERDQRRRPDPVREGNRVERNSESALH